MASAHNQQCSSVKQTHTQSRNRCSVFNQTGDHRHNKHDTCGEKCIPRTTFSLEDSSLTAHESGSDTLEENEDSPENSTLVEENVDETLDETRDETKTIAENSIKANIGAASTTNDHFTNQPSWVVQQYISKGKPYDCLLNSYERQPRKESTGSIQNYFEPGTIEDDAASAQGQFDVVEGSGFDAVWPEPYGATGRKHVNAVAGGQLGVMGAQQYYNSAEGQFDMVGGSGFDAVWPEPYGATGRKHVNAAAGRQLDILGIQQYYASADGQLGAVGEQHYTVYGDETTEPTVSEQFTFSLETELPNNKKDYFNNLQKEIRSGREPFSAAGGKYVDPVIDQTYNVLDERRRGTHEEEYKIMDLTNVNAFSKKQYSAVKNAPHNYLGVTQVGSTSQSHFDSLLVADSYDIEKDQHATTSMKVYTNIGDIDYDTSKKNDCGAIGVEMYAPKNRTQCGDVCKTQCVYFRGSEVLFKGDKRSKNSNGKRSAVASKKNADPSKKKEKNTGNTKRRNINRQLRGTLNADITVSKNIVAAIKQKEYINLGGKGFGYNQEGNIVTAKENECHEAQEKNVLDIYTQNILKELEIILSSVSSNEKKDSPKLKNKKKKCYGVCFVEEIMHTLQILKQIFFLNAKYVESNFTYLLHSLKYKLEQAESSINKQKKALIYKIEYNLKKTLEKMSAEAVNASKQANISLESENYSALLHNEEAESINSTILTYAKEIIFPNTSLPISLMDDLWNTAISLSDNVKVLENHINLVDEILNILECSIVKVTCSQISCSDKTRGISAYNEYGLILSKLVEECYECHTRRIPFRNIHLINTVKNITGAILNDKENLSQMVFGTTEVQLHNQLLQNMKLIVELIKNSYKILFGINTQGINLLLNLDKKYPESNIIKVALQVLKKDKLLLSSWLNQTNVNMQDSNGTKDISLYTTQSILTEPPNSKHALICSHLILKYVVSSYFITHFEKLDAIVKHLSKTESFSESDMETCNSSEEYRKTTETSDYVRSISAHDMARLKLLLRSHNRLVDPYVYVQQLTSDINDKIKYLQTNLKNIWKLIFFLKNGTKHLKKAQESTLQNEEQTKHLNIGYISLIIAHMICYELI